MVKNNWNTKLFSLANFIAQWSKDNGTKVGAVIVDDSHRILSVGYNGLPSGCNDNVPEREERPAKYLYTEHAERNAIFSAARNGVRLDGATIYLGHGLPCADCARAIIQSGIKKIVTTKEPFLSNNNALWDAHFKAACEMLSEAGIIIEYINESES